MKTVTYNGEEISKLSLGTVQFGLDYGIANTTGQPQIENVKKIIDFVSDNGINCFDTASAYGSSEEVLGKTLEPSQKNRIISKLSSDDFEKDFENSIDKSLKRLNSTNLYALLLHDSKLLQVWKNDYSKLIKKLINTKKIKYFGVSIYTEKDFDEALDNDVISIIQVPFNILDQRAIKSNWFQRAKEKNKLIFIRSVYLQGLLLMDEESLPINLQPAIKYLKTLKDYSLKLEMSINTLALSYVNTIAKDSVILFGCDTLQQAKENINGFNKLNDLSGSVISSIYEDFKDVPETIYNPTKW